jgi:predicted enzyme related to lactoylglutathione lyase
MEVTNNHINYVEFKAKDLEQIKKFYNQTFSWSFKNHGEEYVSFSDSGLRGGFEKSDNVVVNGAIVVLYHEDIEGIKAKITANGGSISKEIFTFPGGRRFHFKDPAGNELAVWSDK